MSLHPQMASFSSPCAVTSCRRMRSSRILSCLILLLLLFSLCSSSVFPPLFSFFASFFFLLQLLLFCPFLLHLTVSPPSLPLFSSSFGFLPSLLSLHPSPPPPSISFLSSTSVSGTNSFWRMRKRKGRPPSPFHYHLLGENKEQQQFVLSHPAAPLFPSHPLFSLPPPYLLLLLLSFFQLSSSGQESLLVQSVIKILPDWSD